MVASDKMWVALKIYAADGEKGLQPIRTRTTPLSSCKALWANHETGTIGNNEGVLLPRGTFIGSKRRATNHW
jgi:hypothetical protein